MTGHDKETKFFFFSLYFKMEAQIKNLKISAFKDRAH